MRAVIYARYSSSSQREESIEAQVEAWQLANPSGKKAQCARETGIDPKTIRKWWK